MVKRQSQLSGKVSLKDMRTTLGMACLCRLSSSILAQAAQSTPDPNLARKLNEMSRQRQYISDQLVPPAALNSPIVEKALSEFDEDVTNYQQLNHQLDQFSAETIRDSWTDSFLSVDRDVARNLRAAIHQIDSKPLANRLSSLLANFRLSSEWIHRGKYKGK